MYIAYTGLILFLILCLTYMCLALMAAWQLLRVRATAFVKPNDEDASVETFLDLLEKAKRSMVIYDDGDKVGGSVYDNPGVLEKVEAKLQKDSAFKIQCRFDCDDAKLGFRELCKNHSKQVSIKTLDCAKEDRPDDVHYKIIDDGQKACLSRHGLGSPKRRFKVIDCTRVRPKSVNRLVVQATLGECLEDFDAKFARARLASASSA